MQTDDATVTVQVFKVGDEVSEPTVEPGDGFAKNDSETVGGLAVETDPGGLE